MIFKKEVTDLAEYNYSDPDSKINRGTSKLVKIIVFLCLAWFSFLGIRSLWNKYIVKDKFAVAESLSGFNSAVSAIEVKHELLSIGELATAKYTYLGQAYIKDYRNVLGLDIPFTSHTILITYSGVVKVGYVVDDMEVEVKDTTIYITLPAPRVLDNYIDTYMTEESNNIFNPIETNEVSEKLNEVKEAELEKCRDDAYDKAEKEVKKTILGLLQVFEDYKVKFE